MKLGRRPGQSLIEVTMATMIAAITTTAVFSVVLSSFVSDNRADKRDAAAMAMRHAQEILKSFVSVEPTSNNLLGTYTPALPGGPVSASGVGRWPADGSGVWALRGPVCPTVLNHNISSLVNTSPVLSPAGVAAATLSYDVCSYNCGWFGMGNAPDYPTACKRVTFRLVYTD